MANLRSDVTGFLSRLKRKVRVFQIVYLDNRPKNLQTLAKLEITPKDREKMIMELELEDYSEGPLKECFYGGEGEMFVFGKNINKNEVYIKITLGKPNQCVICISFHIAEYPMNYPFKKE